MRRTDRLIDDDRRDRGVGGGVGLLGEGGGKGEEVGQGVGAGDGGEIWQGGREREGEDQAGRSAREGMVEKTGQGQGQGQGPRESLPIAELIVASHAVLLLFTLASGPSPGPGPNTDMASPSEDRSSSSSSSSRRGVQGPGAGAVSGKQQIEDAHGTPPAWCRPLLGALPGGSWWLPVRVLKAFLALQVMKGGRGHVIYVFV